MHRRIAGALVLVLRQLGLPYAAALFMHASLGTAVTAQYAAITASRQAAHKRQAARASGSAATAEAAVEADACGRLLVALQAESFSSGMWDAAAIGQGLDLVQLEVWYTTAPCPADIEGYPLRHAAFCSTAHNKCRRTWQSTAIYTLYIHCRGLMRVNEKTAELSSLVEQLSSGCLSCRRRQKRISTTA